MERKKKIRSNYPERSANIRIWPGVLLITVCASILFLMVNFLGYKAGLLSMPSFLQVLITGQNDEADNGKNGNAEQHLQPGLIAEETKYTYYQPEKEIPDALLRSLQMPESFHQIMRFTVMDYTGNSRSLVANLYLAGKSWRLEKDNALYISDGISIWRCNENGAVSQTGIGEFHWRNELGLPSLEELQAFGELHPESVSFQETSRTVYVEYIPNENIRINCHIAVDTGLITEMQQYINDRQILFMYTERVSVSPDICQDTDLFTWIEESEN